MDMPEAQRRLSELRERRVRPDAEAAIGPLVEGLGRTLERQHKKLGGVSAAWQQVCPPERLGRTSVAGLSRGVLTIHVSDSAARFELDRMLRSGGERALVRLCPTTVRKVKLVAEDPGPGPRVERR